MFSAMPLHADVLISKSEAVLPDAGKTKFRGISRGPGVKLVSPAEDDGAVSSPFHFKLIFEPHGGATIVPSSVQVLYLKRPMVDLTERLKGGVTENGIDMPVAEVPPGEHHLQVSVMDTNGHTTNMNITLEVGK